MSLTKYMYESSKDIWDRYLTHPFIEEMANGELPIEKYKRYMLEDYEYLKEYLKVLEAGLKKASSSDEEDYLKAHIKETIDELDRVHVPYMKSLGITDAEVCGYSMSDVLKAYTSYMVEVVEKGEFLDVINVILSCSWSYAYIGEYMKKNNLIKSGSIYEDWFNSYSGKEYQSANSHLIEMVEKYGAATDKADELCRIFRKCSEYELKFWNYLYE